MCNATIHPGCAPSETPPMRLLPFKRDLQPLPFRNTLSTRFVFSMYWWTSLPTLFNNNTLATNHQSQRQPFGTTVARRTPSSPPRRPQLHHSLCRLGLCLPHHLQALGQGSVVGRKARRELSKPTNSVGKSYRGIAVLPGTKVPSHCLATNRDRSPPPSSFLTILQSRGSIWKPLHTGSVRTNLCELASMRQSTSLWIGQPKCKKSNTCRYSTKHPPEHNVAVTDSPIPKCKRVDWVD